VPRRHIQSAFVKENLEAAVISKQFDNLRQEVNRATRCGYTSTQALIKQFEDDRVKHVVRFAESDPGRVNGLFWTYPRCEEMWKRYHFVLHLDNTYKTNRFKMSQLVQLVTILFCSELYM
jgi:hypothetical protein